MSFIDPNSKTNSQANSNLPSVKPASIEAVAEDAISFIRKTVLRQEMKTAVVAVSGGIDSATVATLAARALDPECVFPVFLPFSKQSTADAEMAMMACGIPEVNWNLVQIDPIVISFIKARPGARADKVRVGNAMARARMIVLFDIAKQFKSLVCGTENRSEKYLGYFTRFGDGASDLEPIHHLYKTQVRQLAEYLRVPAPILAKPPSAGLWRGQSDEDELGFTYEDADQVLLAVFGDASGLATRSTGRATPGKPHRGTNLPWSSLTGFKSEVAKVAKITGVEPEIVERILTQVTTNWFKQLTPYSF